MKTKICNVCEREHPATKEFFKGRPTGLENTCRVCGGADSMRYRRTPEHPYVLRIRKPGERSKHCVPCNRDIPLFGFDKNRAMKDGLSARCQDCSYLQNTFGTPYPVVQVGPPLKRAYYEERVIDGRRVVVREIR